MFPPVSSFGIRILDLPRSLVPRERALRNHKKDGSRPRRRSHSTTDEAGFHTGLPRLSGQFRKCGGVSLRPLACPVEPHDPGYVGRRHAERGHWLAQWSFTTFPQEHVTVLAERSPKRPAAWVDQELRTREDELPFPLTGRERRSHAHRWVWAKCSSPVVYLQALSCGRYAERTTAVERGLQEGRLGLFGSDSGQKALSTHLPLLRGPTRASELGSTSSVPNGHERMGWAGAKRARCSHGPTESGSVARGGARSSRTSLRGRRWGRFERRVISQHGRMGVRKGNWRGRRTVPVMSLRPAPSRRDGRRRSQRVDTSSASPTPRLLGLLGPPARAPIIAVMSSVSSYAQMGSPILHLASCILTTLPNMQYARVTPFSCVAFLSPFLCSMLWKESLVTQGFEGAP